MSTRRTGHLLHGAELFPQLEVLQLDGPGHAVALRKKVVTEVSGFMGLGAQKLDDQSEVLLVSWAYGLDLRRTFDIF